jgi:U3 small nucleolar RNA-associated protein 16
MFAHLVTAAKGLFARPENSDSADSNMVTTRRGEVAPELANGKRKTNKADEQQTKRRRKSDPTDMEIGDASDVPAASNANEDKAPVEKKNHFRFDSEEPELPETLPEETAEEPMQEDEDEDEDSDDDDAPEAIDNSAQLLKMKEQAKKREAANQLYVLITYFVSNKTCLQCL